MSDKPADRLTWETDFPLATNPRILAAWSKAMVATYAASMVILGGVLAGFGELDGLPVLALIFAGVVGALFSFGLLAMVVVLGNRSRMRYLIDGRGIRAESVDRLATTAARLAAAAGALRGHPGAAGAGLLAKSNEVVALSWRGAFAARYDPGAHTVVLRNRWRELMHVYCTPENYAEVSGRIAAAMERHGTEARLAGQRSPAPRALALSAAVMVAMLPLFALTEICDLEPLTPVFVFVFALAMVWLLPLFAWPVLALLAYVLVRIAIVLFETREIGLLSVRRFRGYELLDSTEWAGLIFALAAAAFLAWLAWRHLRGKWLSVLGQDVEDAS